MHNLYAEPPMHQKINGCYLGTHKLRNITGVKKTFIEVDKYLQNRDKEYYIYHPQLGLYEKVFNPVLQHIPKTCDSK
jgi:hypothetical protein